MLYGETGSGKTTSILQSAPDPILYIATEPRSLQESINAAARSDVDLDVVNYEAWPELIEYVANRKNFDRYSTIVVDSYSHLMTVGLSVEIEDESFDARKEEDKTIKPITLQAKLTLEGYGGLASNMFRLTAALCRLSQFEGKIVIITALLVENPRYNRELAAAPSLKGKEFPANMPGFFDLIGKVETRKDGDGRIIYPPIVRFESPEGDFMAKFTGVRKPGAPGWGPLNLVKILKLNGKETQA